MPRRLLEKVLLKMAEEQTLKVVEQVRVSTRVARRTSAPIAVAAYRTTRFGRRRCTRRSLPAMPRTRS